MVTLSALLLAVGCSNPQEGERWLVAGLLEIEGLAWRVKCGETTQERLDARRQTEWRNADYWDQQSFSDFDLSRGKVAANRDHDWASRALARCKGKRRW